MDVDSHGMTLVSFISGAARKELWVSTSILDDPPALSCWMADQVQRFIVDNTLPADAHVAVVTGAVERPLGALIND